MGSKAPVWDSSKNRKRFHLTDAQRLELARLAELDLVAAEPLLRRVEVALALTR